MLGRLYPQFSSLLVLLLLGSAVAACYAQAPASPDVSLRETRQIAAGFTSERLQVWQKRLNLTDWNISVVMERAANLKPKTLGNIHWDLDRKTAIIRVLDPADYKMQTKEMLQDMEFTIVHELIHLNFAPVVSEFQRSEANRREEEHAVNHMADALLKLDCDKDR